MKRGKSADRHGAFGAMPTIETLLACETSVVWKSYDSPQAMFRLRQTGASRDSRQTGITRESVV